MAEGSGLDVRIVPAPEVKKTIAQLKSAQLITPMRREMKLVIDEGVGLVQNAAMSIPSKGNDPKPSLRAEIAKAVTKVTAFTAKNVSVGIKIPPNKMSTGRGSLPEYMEGSGRPLRHPVFGHMDQPWVTQESHAFFYNTLAKIQAQMDIAIARVSRKYEDQLK